MICCDSLNYLKDEKDVLDTFKSVFSLLKDDGLLLFDVHSVYKMDDVFPGSTYADQDEEISVIWQSFPGEAVHSVVHDLTFFVENGGVYERFDETHEQRTFETEEYTRFLRASGFDVQQITADFSDRKPAPDTERHFYTAKKLKPSFNMTMVLKMPFSLLRNRIRYATMNQTWNCFLTAAISSSYFKWVLRNIWRNMS